MEINNIDYNRYTNLDYSSLLDRQEIDIGQMVELNYLKNKTILVTGGVGSIGCEIVRTLVKYKVHIIIYDNNECNYFYLQKELRDYNNVTFVLGCINDSSKLENIFIENEINLVYHAAAYKHVPILEDNEYESVKVNVIGTKIVSDLSLKYNVDKFIYVSTDKAVNPTSVMGTCKRVSERYINYLWNKHKSTGFITTRFGNVLGSSGSILPTLLRNISENKDLEITHVDITRYFMTISEASKLVVLSSCICIENNKVLFDMGSPVNIYGFAKNILKYLNREDLAIKIVGLRPGEKLHEELFYDSEAMIKTKYDKIILLKTGDHPDSNNFQKKYNDLISIQSNESRSSIRRLLADLVPECTIQL